METPGAKYKAISGRALFCAFVLSMVASAQAQTSSKDAVSVDLLITGGTIVTMDAGRRILQYGFLAARADGSVAIGSGSGAALTFAPKGLIIKQKTDARSKLMRAGLRNGDT